MKGTLFKAKSLRGEWVKGFYWNNRIDEHYIRIVEETPFFRIEDSRINPETLCKSIGIYDANGEEIFDNFIVEFEDTGEDEYEYHEGFDYANKAVVKIIDGLYTLKEFRFSGNSSVEESVYDNDYEEIKSVLKSSKVVGNIFDNPELVRKNNSDDKNHECERVVKQNFVGIVLTKEEFSDFLKTYSIKNDVDYYEEFIRDKNNSSLRGDRKYYYGENKYFEIEPAAEDSNSGNFEFDCLCKQKGYTSDHNFKYAIPLTDEFSDYEFDTYISLVFKGYKMLKDYLPKDFDYDLHIGKISYDVTLITMSF